MLPQGLNLLACGVRRGRATQERSRPAALPLASEPPAQACRPAERMSGRNVARGEQMDGRLGAPAAASAREGGRPSGPQRRRARPAAALAGCVTRLHRCAVCSLVSTRCAVVGRAVFAPARGRRPASTRASPARSINARSVTVAASPPISARAPRRRAPASPSPRTLVRGRDHPRTAPPPLCPRARSPPPRAPPSCCSHACLQHACLAPATPNHRDRGRSQQSAG